MTNDPTISPLVPMASDDRTLWAAYSAAVEAIEPGASRHCCLRTWDGDRVVSYSHPRLGIRVGRS